MGKVREKVITFGYREADDVDAAVSFLRSRTSGIRLCALGFSLGGAATVLSASLQEFDALILEAVYPTIEQAVDNRLRMRFGGLGVRLKPLLLWQLQWRLHVNPGQACTSISDAASEMSSADDWRRKRSADKTGGYGTDV